MTGRLTPVEAHGDILVKRDDLFSINGMRGGKVRTAARLVGPPGVITAGSRHSPQTPIVAAVAQAAGVPCRVHVPQGPTTPEVERAESYGAEVVRHFPGHTTVITARARADAETSGWRLVPFGMECQEAVAETARQVANLPLDDISRVVVPVGSGMTLAGILYGLPPSWWRRVVGVMVGAAPTKRLDRWAPSWWRDIELVNAGMPYHARPDTITLDGIDLDPVYEAKCLPFLRPGDLFWVVGHRDPLPSTWKISAAWAMRPHDCTPHGITRDGGCGGACCTNQAFWPARSDPAGKACVHLGPDGCRFTPADRPVTCLLYPLVPNRAGTLVRHFRAPGAVCGSCVGDGPPLIDAMADSFTALVGATEYRRIRAEVAAGRDPIVAVPPDIAAALQREREEEAVNVPPVARGGAP